MTDTRFRFLTGGQTLRMALVLPAAALIFLGSVFQLGMLGYGQLNPHEFWPLAMIAQSAWGLFSGLFNAPEFANIARFWPLLLVVCGLSILVALKPAARKPVRQFEIRRRVSSW